MQVTNEMEKLAYEIMNKSEERDEAYANDNSGLAYNIEIEQRDSAEELAMIILNLKKGL